MAEINNNDKSENALLSLLKEVAEGQDGMLSKTVTKAIESTTYDV